ncbi:MAG: signal peptidase II [Candidatus Pacebacteria bacterium]|nr:signal peptidase II [Candidatus Paceibacterota bacterium]MDR3583646.1 signal peptidase II [Candidatus Paceibacterota bacterium]
MYELRKKIARYFFVVSGFFLILLDQFMKYEIRSRGGFYICNAGLAFGIKLSYFILAVVIFGIAAFIITAGNHKSQASNKKQIPISKHKIQSQCWLKKLRFGILLVLSGAISNIVDRIFFGCVIDYINLRVWPVFNLADVYITIGGALIIWKIVKEF